MGFYTRALLFASFRVSENGLLRIKRCRENSRAVEWRREEEIENEAKKKKCEDGLNQASPSIIEAVSYTHLYNIGCQINP